MNAIFFWMPGGRGTRRDSWGLGDWENSTEAAIQKETDSPSQQSSEPF